MNIVKNRKIFYSISGVLVVLSIVALSFWGLVLGIDFKGGTIVEFKYEGNRPEISQVKGALDSTNLSPSIVGSYTLVSSGDLGYKLKSRNLAEEERVVVENAISNISSEKVSFDRFNSIGPALGKEAGRKSMIAIVLVLVFIVLYITFAFRKVSKPVSSWKYGLITITALAHDVLIPTGIFAVLGHYLGYEVDTLFVTALLVILGFSVHDTIVVFDRVRENLKHSRERGDNKPFVVVVNESINQTFARSINTSFTTLLAILAVYFLGPDTIKNFSLVLIAGVFFGTYSSIFIASNLLVSVEKMIKR